MSDNIDKTPLDNLLSDLIEMNWKLFYDLESEAFCSLDEYKNAILQLETRILELLKSTK